VWLLATNSWPISAIGRRWLSVAQTSKARGELPCWHWQPSNPPHPSLPQTGVALDNSLSTAANSSDRGWRIHGVLCHVCGAWGYHPGMPPQRHYYGLSHLHFITASTYRRARLFDSGKAWLRRLTSGGGQASGSICWGMIPSFPWITYRDRIDRDQCDGCATLGGGGDVRIEK